MAQGKYLRQLLLSVMSATALHAVAQQSTAANHIAEDTPIPTNQVIRTLEEKNEQRAKSLGSYSSTRVYKLSYHGFPGDREAEMTVHVEYTAPNVKHFTVTSESGSKFLINHVLKRLLEAEQEATTSASQHDTALTTDNYDIAMERYDASTADGEYVLKLTPKTGSKFLYRGLVNVDARDFAVTRIAAEPARNPSFWIRKTDIEHTYERIDGFWLPARDHTVSLTRSGGHGDLTIEYRDYKIVRAPAMLAHSTLTTP